MKNPDKMSERELRNEVKASRPLVREQAEALKEMSQFVRMRGISAETIAVIDRATKVEKDDGFFRRTI